MHSEDIKKIKTLLLQIDGKQLELINSDELKIEHMVRITCNYEDGTNLSVWMEVKSVIDNIRMIGVTYRNQQGFDQSL